EWENQVGENPFLLKYKQCFRCLYVRRRCALTHPPTLGGGLKIARDPCNRESIFYCFYENSSWKERMSKLRNDSGIQEPAR
ncbi:MAG: hypothetical protein D6805_09665, partial [Planctomycetota bacterium]